MIEALKIILILLIMLLLAYPILPLPSKARKFSTFHSLKYKSPHNRKNIVFVLLVIVEFVAVVVVSDLLKQVVNTIYNLPFIGNLISNAVGGVGVGTDYVIFAITLVLFNLVILYTFVLIKAFLKKCVFDAIFGFYKSRKELREKKKAEKEQKKQAKLSKKQQEEQEEQDKRKPDRVPGFIHSTEDPDEDDGKTDVKKENVATEEEKKPKKRRSAFMRAILGLFFEGDDFETARKWVERLRLIVQTFIYLVEALYGVFVLVVLLSVFFPLPSVINNLLINVLHIQDWYIYPFISLIFLQELCNVFETPAVVDKKPETEEEKKEAIEEGKREANLRALQTELKRRFDSEHSLRYYPPTTGKTADLYQITNQTYASALNYIRKYMESTAGRAVESYMEFLDAIYNDDHVYFAASFYSELGEYLVAYSYIRLLSGARMIYVVSDAREKETLKKFLSDRLMKMTGTNENCTWRVYTSDERLDQADVLIVSPADFSDDNMVEQYPGFFEEACNAVFIDVDKMIALDSYLCPIMASRLQKATDGNIRFVFLTLDLLKGFAAGSLPKFFSVDKVLSFSSAKENEQVAYTIWNKESKKNRIYNRHGQNLTSLECIIAQQACVYGVDGVRLITKSPIEHAERKTLAQHKVEINNLYKDVADVNYMVYSDDRCNLSAALYACTRFRGRKKSIVHILSKPYLLREYFMSKAISEDYINRSSFIQPRVTEHAERHKLSLLRIFCDTTSGKGMRISEFENRMRAAISVCKERGDYVSSRFCRDMLDNRRVETLKVKDLAAYLVAGLYDNEKSDPKLSIGYRAKDYFLIVDPNKIDGYTLQVEKYIVFNRVKEIFDSLFSCNNRVELRLNDQVVGLLDTYPDRVHLEYIAGQSLVYNNSEYEIEHITEDGKTVYLRRENIKFKHCLDTVHLRRYSLLKLRDMGKVGVLNSTKSCLEEIKVEMLDADFIGETYGFYSLMTDRQTLDFYRGVEGTPNAQNKHVRNINNGRILLTTLTSKETCTDGMRMLLAAVFNEFIRTIFPDAYHCVAICPILENPIAFNSENEPKSEIERISALYPYIQNAREGLEKDQPLQMVETNQNQMRFAFINDCVKDVGVLDWFYDQAALYMQEFLANIYSYLHWLQLHKDKQHYIYFGGKELPSCYDLDGCCNLLKDYNLVLSDDGKKDFETAGEEEISNETLRCSFCHRLMESGRYEQFDKNRYICADCFDVVDNKETLEDLYVKVKEYFEKTYPDVSIGNANIGIDNVYELEAGKVLSENYYRVLMEERKIMVERDTPEHNAEISLLRGLIELWQNDNNLVIAYATAQLYFEELKYLRSHGRADSAEWIYNQLDKTIRDYVDEIQNYVDGKTEEQPVDEQPAEDTDETGEADVDPNAVEPNDEETETDDGASGEVVVRTSFTFMREKAKELDDLSNFDDDGGEEGEDASDKLFNPNKVPRFWKRYLRHQDIDDGEEEIKQEDGSDGEDEEDAEDVLENSKVMSWNEFVNSPLVDGEGEDGGEENTEGDSDVDGESVEDTDVEEADTTDTESGEGQTDELPEETENKPKKKKEGFFSKLFGKKNKPKKDQSEQPTIEQPPVDEIPEEEIGEEQPEIKEIPKKKEKPPKQNKPKKVKVFKGKTPGEKICPREEDEETNPAIRLYNELVRACYNYKEEPLDRRGLSDKEVQRVFVYVKGDYPEIFWLQTYSYNSNEMTPIFRCKDANGKFDVEQVKAKRLALHKASKQFTKGISRRTDPYQAMLKIYRKLILTLDYDGRGLEAGVDTDLSKDDSLRSLYSALVEHKVVCAGYAAAMQYLLQKVGIVCGYVISEMSSPNSCHAFNIVKIGKYVYYLDATWGDLSDTKTGDKEKENVYYNYCCVPYNEFILTPPSQRNDHIPRKEYYPELKQMQYANHEYYRYHGAYLTRYNAQEVVRIFAESAIRYNKDEMGSFAVSFRCCDASLARYTYDRLVEKQELFTLLPQAVALAKKKSKKAGKLLAKSQFQSSYNKNANTMIFYL